MNAVHANSPYMESLGIAGKKIEQLPIDVRIGSDTMSATTIDLHFSNGWNSIEVAFRGDHLDHAFRSSLSIQSRLFTAELYTYALRYPSM